LNNLKKLLAKVNLALIIETVNKAIRILIYKLKSLSLLNQSPRWLRDFGNNYLYNFFAFFLLALVVLPTGPGARPGPSQMALITCGTEKRNVTLNLG